MPPACGIGCGIACGAGAGARGATAFGSAAKDGDLGIAIPGAACGGRPCCPRSGATGIPVAVAGSVRFVSTLAGGTAVNPGAGSGSAFETGRRSAVPAPGMPWTAGRPVGDPPNPPYPASGVRATGRSIANRGFAVGWKVDAGGGGPATGRLSGMRAGRSPGAAAASGMPPAPGGTRTTFGATGRDAANVAPATAVTAPGTRPLL